MAQDHQIAIELVEGTRSSVRYQSPRSSAFLNENDVCNGFEQAEARYTFMLNAMEVLMKIVFRFGLVVSAAVTSAGSWLEAQAQQQPPQSPNLTFFVTSAGPGKGADLGGVEGADRHCQTLAQAVGAGGKTWHAYLSTQGAAGGTSR